VVREAADALERARFAHLVADEFDVLRGDQQAWIAYLGDAELTVDDGVAQRTVADGCR